MSEGAFLLRDAVPGDLEAMYQLDVICFEEEFRFDRASMMRYATMPGAIPVVAQSGSSLAGFVIGNVSGRGAKRIAYITTLDIAPEFRRSGVARALMTRLEQKAKESGVSSAELHVWTQNIPATEFYAKAGYRRVGHVAEFYGAGRDAWFYRKALRLGGSSEPTASPDDSALF